MTVLITRFIGQDAASERFALHLGPTLREAIPGYVERALGEEGARAGLSAQDVEVQYVPCFVESHEQARAIGQAWGADTVLWGSAIAPASEAEAAVAKLLRVIQNLPPGSALSIGTGNEITAGKGSSVQTGVILNVQNAPPPVSFRTSLTAARLQRLQTVSAGRAEVVSAPALQKLDFAALAPDEPLVLFQLMLGVLAHSRQRYQIAAQLFAQIGPQRFGQAEDRAELLGMAGMDQVYAGQKKEGTATLEQALAACGSTAMRCRAKGLHNLGWAATRSAAHERALDYYLQSLLRWREVGDPRGEALTLNNIGWTFFSLKQQAKAREYFEQALAIQRRTGDVKGEATTLNNLGHTYARQGSYQKALAYYLQALPLRRQAGDSGGEAATLGSIGLAYLELADGKNAMDYLNQALTAAREVGDRLSEGIVLSNLGHACATSSRHPEALKYLEQALVILRQVDEPEVTARLLGNLAATHVALQDKKRALAYYEQELQLRIELNDKENTLRLYRSIGDLYSQVGDKQKAAEYHKKAQR